ncbi:MAG: sigma-70 family RNA polymerase sigma factor [Planctomycetaceae bacterium]|nr:sigma-70 family RNA polymerase sigma factor [Planctomycetaceae bacterium]
MPDNERLLVETVRSAIAANDSNTAISALFEAYGERLTKMIAIRLDPRLAGRIDPADVLQDAFIDVIKKLPQYDLDCQIPLYIWMRTIVQERIVATHRRHLNTEKRDARLERDRVYAANPDESAWSLAQVLLSNDTSISGRVIRAEQHDQLATALTCLEPIDHEIILLRIFENLTNLEVAQSLQIETSAASKRFLRAMDRLGEILRSFPGCQSSLIV